MNKIYTFGQKIRAFYLMSIVLSVLVISTTMNAQNVAITDIDSYTAEPSAMLDVKSTSKGMLIPRLTTDQRLGITLTAVDGLMVYDTDFKSFFYYKDTTWTAIPNIKFSGGIGVALFAVVNAAGDTIFAVYNDGVKITLPEGAKGSVGGFAVSGRTPTKAGEEVDYFRVTPDSTRVYVNDSIGAKGKVGGFAVSGRTPTKGSIYDYFYINKDSTRIYINDTITAKGKIGGFAISGRTPTKGYINEYLFVNQDSTRVYVNDTSVAKGKVGGFAVSGRTPVKGDPSKYMDITRNNYLIGQEAGMNITTGLYNSYMGYQAGKFTKGGSKNIYLGFQAGLKTDNANENIFIGYQAGNQNLGGNWNTFLGTEAGYTNTGSDNTFIGYQAGKMHQSQGGNVYIGSKAGRDATNGQQNVYIGESTGLSTTYAKSNVFIGYESGKNIKGSATADSIGSYNVYLGYQAGSNGETIFKNVFLGYKAGMNSRYEGVDPNDGSVNVFIGSEAGKSNTIGRANTAIGENALWSNTTGIWNVALGRRPLYSNISGNANIAIGFHSLFYNQTGKENIAIGSFALVNNITTNNNIAIGTLALGLSLDSSNVAVGRGSLSYLKYGSKNTALGNGANVSIPAGTYNNVTVLGYGATAIASNQVVIGNNEVTNVTIPGVYNDSTVSESSNVYVNSFGQIMRTVVPTVTGTGSINKIAFWNGVGSSTLSYSANLHWDNTNTRLGMGASAPSYNLSFGGGVARTIGMERRTITNGAGYSLTINSGGATSGSLNYSGGDLNLSSGIATGTGSSNIYFKTSTAGSSGTTDRTPSTKMTILGSGNIGIGTTDPATIFHIYQPAGALPVRITKVSTTNYWGFGLRVTDSDNNLVFAYNGTNKASVDAIDGSWDVASDERLKTNIEPLEKVLNKVLMLKPSSFYFKSDINKQRKSIGFIAQDVEKVFPNLINEFVDEDGNNYKGLSYNDFAILSIQAIIELNAKHELHIDTLSSEIENLKNENDQIRSDYNLLKKELELIKEKLLK